MRFRRFRQRYDPNIKTAVDLTESYRGQLMSVFVTRLSEATVSWIVYIDGKRAHAEVLIGDEAEALAFATRRGCALIDEMLNDRH